MADYVGQRLDDGAALPGRYVRLPAAAAAQIRDGKPVGANLAMAWHNNASHACEQSHRHLVAWVKGGALSQTDGWSGLVDARDPASGGLSTISWSPTVARRWGPFFAIEDRVSLAADLPAPPTPGEPVARRIAWDIQAKSGAAATLAIYLAVTAGLDPQPPTVGALVDTSFFPGTSLAVTTKTLNVPMPLGGATRVRARPRAAGGRVEAEALVLPYWLWLGWRSTNGSDRLLAASAYETR